MHVGYGESWQIINQRKPGLWENPVSFWVAIAPVQHWVFSPDA